MKFIKRLFYRIRQRKYITLRGVTIETYIGFSRADKMNFLFYPSQQFIEEEMQKQKEKAKELRLALHNC